MVEHLVLSLVLVALFAWGYRRALSELMVVVVICALLFLGLLAAPSVTWLALLALTVLAVACQRSKVRATRFSLASVGTIALVYGIFAAVHYPRYREAADLRKAYPPISLAERLACEPLAGRIPPPSGNEPMPPEPVASELSRFEEKVGEQAYGAMGSRRHAALRSLAYMHGGFVDDFMRAQGFGVVRMGPRLPAKRQYIEIPEVPTLPQAEAPVEPSEQTPGALPADVAAVDADRESIKPPGPVQLRDLHEAGAVDFANPLGFGYVVGRERVVGFQPHGFRNRPELSAGTDGPSRWQLTSLELVSLLKHEAPVAYLSKNLPRMDDLDDAAIRPLDEFEIKALSQLRAGEEIVFESTSDELRMLGSLRAARLCTECHSVNRGDLLGAFTYRLRRDVPIRRKPVPAAKPVT
jgi:hypothetical protein